MIISKPWLATKLDVWFPRYHDQWEGERVALLHKDKVDHATLNIIVEFTKAKHLKGQRFAISRAYAQTHAVGTNGSAPMYIIPMSHFEDWVSGSEVIEEVKSLGWL